MAIDLSRMLRMPMTTIEAIGLVLWLETILQNRQRAAIVLVKKWNVTLGGTIPGDTLGCHVKGDTHAESAVLRDRFLALGDDAGRHGSIGPEGLAAAERSA